MNEQVKIFLENIKTKAEIEVLCNYLSTKATTFSDPQANGVIYELELSLTKYFKKKYAVVMNSGTSAINSAYFAMNFEPGDEILVPAYCFYSAISPLHFFGIKAIAVPISHRTLNIDFSLINKFITNRSKAILSTSMTGLIPDQEEISKISNNYNIKVIEDFSRAYTSSKNSTLIGDVSCFSMQDSKALSAIEGGILLTDSIEIYERAIAYSQPGRIAKSITSDYLKAYLEGGIGQKYRINTLGALLAISGVQSLEDKVKLSNINYERFQKMISKYSYLSPIESYNSPRGAWKDGYAKIISSNQNIMARICSLSNKKGIPITQEYRDNWVPNIHLRNKITKNLDTSLRIFNSILVFNGICSYTKDNTIILQLFEEIFKEV